MTEEEYLEHWYGTHSIEISRGNHGACYGKWFIRVIDEDGMETRGWYDRKFDTVSDALENAEYLYHRACEEDMEDACSKY